MDKEFLESFLETQLFDEEVVEFKREYNDYIDRYIFELSNPDYLV